ncbi:hypothetical protein WJX72_010450 [[Myrmecia] bisecta]|uniref:DJ-1/PfpI domain-containing protein n=1 Tax=[Myrmecia] bisecta TaxID=41462 RepID=A0AAW1PQM9_9CHLO
MGDWIGSPKTIGFFLWPGFTVLDAFGPMEMFGKVAFASADFKPPPAASIKLVIIGKEKLVVAQEGTKIQVDHTFDDCPELDALLVPGGSPDDVTTQANDPAVRNFLAGQYQKLSPDPKKFFMTVCTGAFIAAKSGVLNGHTCTTNKMAFDWVKAHTAGLPIKWKCVARWVADGKVWTSSGISAGTDMSLAFIAARYGDELAEAVRHFGEWNGEFKDPSQDPFAQGNCTCDDE